MLECLAKKGVDHEVVHEGKHNGLGNVGENENVQMNEKRPIVAQKDERFFDKIKVLNVLQAGEICRDEGAKGDNDVNLDHDAVAKHETRLTALITYNQIKRN